MVRVRVRFFNTSQVKPLKRFNSRTLDPVTVTPTTRQCALLLSNFEDKKRGLIRTRQTGKLVLLTEEKSQAVIGETLAITCRYNN